MDFILSKEYKDAKLNAPQKNNISIYVNWYDWDGIFYFIFLGTTVIKFVSRNKHVYFTWINNYEMTMISTMCSCTSASEATTFWIAIRTILSIYFSMLVSCYHQIWEYYIVRLVYIFS